MPSGRRKTIGRNTRAYPDLVVDVYLNMDRLRTKIDRIIPDANGCLNWTGPRHRQGYGFVGVWSATKEKKIMHTVHRLLVKEREQSDLAGLDVFHTCGNHSCCNIDHLQALTTKQLMVNVGHRITSNPIKKKQPKRYYGTGIRPTPRNQTYVISLDDTRAIYRRELELDELVIRYPNLTKARLQSFISDIRSGRRCRWLQFEGHTTGGKK